MHSPTAISVNSFTTQPNPAQPSPAQHNTNVCNTDADTDTETQKDTHTYTHTHTEKERRIHTHKHSKARHQTAKHSKCAHVRCALSGVCRSPCRQERPWGCCAGALPGCLPALPHQARALPPCVTSALALSGLDPAPASQQT